MLFADAEQDWVREVREELKRDLRGLGAGCCCCWGGQSWSCISWLCVVGVEGAAVVTHFTGGLGCWVLGCRGAGGGGVCLFVAHHSLREMRTSGRGAGGVRG